MTTPTIGFLALFCLAGTAAAQDWPAFRGPHGDGTTSVDAPPLRWDADTNLRWKTALPRPANGSPIVVGDHVLLTWAEDDDGKARTLACFARADGEMTWAATVEIDAVMPTHRTNPYGGTTPASDGERVVVWHASAGLFCYSVADGEELWRRELGEFRHRWGYGTSPVLHDGRVILHSGPGKSVFLAAFDLESGETVWRFDEPLDGDGQDNAEGRLLASYSSPVLVADDERMLVLCSMPTRMIALDAADGSLVWWCEGFSCHRGDLAYANPVVCGDVAFAVGGYEAPAFAVRLGGNGDVTETHRLWRKERVASAVGSGVAVDGRIYWPDMRGFVHCLEPESGDESWSGRPARGSVWSSLVAAGGRIYVLNQRGVTAVFEPNAEELVVVATNELGESTNATPAFAGDEIVIRTDRHLYCIATAADAGGRDG